HLCRTETFCRAWILDVRIGNPRKHFPALVEHLLCPCPLIRENFDRHSRIADHWNNCLHDFLYSCISSRFESLCPDAISSLMCGFLAIKDGLVVCPSTNPKNSLTRRVSCGSPPSTNIFVLGRVIGMLLSVRTSSPSHSVASL